MRKTDVYEFLEKLSTLFENDKDAESFNLRSRLYSKILKKKENELKKKLDYEKMLEKILSNYSYKSFPNLAEILNNLAFRTEIKQNLPETETKQYVFKINNYEYVFQQVPSEWENIHKLSDFENITEKKYEFNDAAAKFSKKIMQSKKGEN